MSRTLKQVRESMEVHTVFVIYKDGKPLNAHGRIAYEREQDAKAMITSMVNGEARRTARNDPEYKSVAEAIRARYGIVPYRAVEA